MDCPKCKSEMAVADLDGMIVARCTQCFGFWFRESDYKLLSKVKGSETIDVGCAEVGRDFNSAEEVPCPECGCIMDRVPAPSQPHIRLEACPEGHGAFFDAGEYRDFKTKSVTDLLKRLF